MKQDDTDKLDWLRRDSAMPSLIEHWRQQRVVAPRATSLAFSFFGVASDTIVVRDSTAASVYPDVLLQAVVELGQQTEEGHIITGVSLAWLSIIAELERDPESLFTIPWRKLEEIIAGAYEHAGWSVILTPSSGDGGRDIIATHSDIVSIRILDQVKAYKPGHVVKADEVRSMLGVLAGNPNASKGLVTTTSGFAPGIEKDPAIMQFVPNRLELKNGDQLREWLSGLAIGGSTGI